MEVPLFICVLRNKMDLDMQSRLFTIRFASTKPKLNYNKVHGPTTPLLSQLWSHMRHLKPPTNGLWLHL